MTVDTPGCKCLDCGHPFDAATSFTTDDVPNEGDISVCLECGHVMAFNSDLTVRELNDEEMKYVAGDPHILKIQAARARVVKVKAKTK